MNGVYTQISTRTTVNNADEGEVAQRKFGKPRTVTM